MLDELEALSRQFVAAKNRPFRRYFLNRWKLDERLVIVVGPRGVGKTTCMIQHLCEWTVAIGRGGAGLFVQVDHVAVGDKTIYDIALEFHQMGGKLLCLDEIHKVQDWQKHLKSVYETFPDLKVVASGSCALAVFAGAQDLSRRAIVVPIEVLSFREFIALRTGMELPSTSLDALLKGHVKMAGDVVAHLDDGGHKVLALFREYLCVGAYPYFLEFERPESFLMTVEQNIRTAVETDLPAVHQNLTGASARRMRQLLAIIARSVPFVPDLKHLSELLGVGDERTLKTYMKYLEDAGLIRSLSRSGRGLRELEKPDRIYLHSTSQCHAVAGGRTPDPGNVRETFLLSMLSEGHKVVAAGGADFLVDGSITMEVGGRSKTQSQLRNSANGWLAIDGIEVGSRNRIPLYLFGFLY